jgi:hypothetical protein
MMRATTAAITDMGSWQISVGSVRLSKVAVVHVAVHVSPTVQLWSREMVSGWNAHQVYEELTAVHGRLGSSSA